MFFWYVFLVCFFSSYRHFETLRVDLRFVRAFAESGCISLLLYPQQLVILFRLLQWQQLVDICGSQHETKSHPKLNVCTPLRTATAAHKHLRPAKSRHAPDEVCGGVGCVRQQS